MVQLQRYRSLPAIDPIAKRGGIVQLTALRIRRSAETPVGGIDQRMLAKIELGALNQQMKLHETYRASLDGYLASHLRRSSRSRASVSSESSA